MKLYKRILFLLLGIFIISCSINTIITSALGATPWDSANFTLSEYFNITPGIATFITGAILTISIEIVNYKNFKVNKLLNMLITIGLGFILGMFINFTSSPISIIIPENKIFGIIGIISFGLGINFISSSKLPADPIDNFMIKIVDYYNFSIPKARIIIDFVALSISFSFGLLLWQDQIFDHYLGIGTLIAFFLLPFSIKIFEPLFLSKK